MFNVGISGKLDGQILPEHVGCSESFPTGLGQRSVEGEAHWSFVRILLEDGSAVAQRVLAVTRSVVGDLILIPIGDHNEQLESHSFVIALREEHVLWPTAMAMVVFLG